MARFLVVQLSPLCGLTPVDDSIYHTGDKHRQSVCGLPVSGVEAELPMTVYLREHRKPSFPAHRRHAVRPGVTAPAQAKMRGRRRPPGAPMERAVRLACDLHYIRNVSLWLDIKIMAGTPVFRTDERQGLLIKTA